MQDLDCAGAGGAHAGYGGSGGSESGKSQCSQLYPTPFYKGVEAKSEGSGGTSGDPDKLNGGSGGGIAWLSTPKTIIIDDDSSVEADGKWGLIRGYEENGSGGGAGGAI